MKWNQGTASTERFTLKISGANYFFDPCLWFSDIPPNVDAASATHSPLLRHSRKLQEGRAQWAGSLYQGWQGSDRTGWKQEDSLGGLCRESVYPGWLASKKVLTFSTSWCDTCDIKCVSWGLGVWRSTPLNCCSPSTLHSPCFSAPSGGAASPGFRQVPGPALQQLLHLGPMPGCLACSPPDSHIPGGRPRAGSEKKMLSFFLLNKIIIIYVHL